MCRNSVPGCPASGPGPGREILLFKLLPVPGSCYLHTSQPPRHYCPSAANPPARQPTSQPARQPAHSAASSQGSALSSQISLGFLPATLFWKAFPLCYRSYLPVCFLLAKRLALIHLHKHRTPQTQVSSGLCLAGKELPLKNLLGALSVAACCLRCLSVLIFRMGTTMSCTSQGCCEDYVIINMNYI